MPTPHDPTLVRLTLRPAPGWSGPPFVRLRRLLKSMRSFGWICVRVDYPDGATAEDLDQAGGATAPRDG